MVKRDNRISLLLGAPGLFLHSVGMFALNSRNPEVAPTLTTLAETFAGTGLVIAGLWFYARAKGRHPAWRLAGFLGILGCLEDRS